MFESGYAFKILTVAHPTSELPLIKKQVYDFRTNLGRRYLVHIHEYDYKCFVIKFHDARHKNMRNRYNITLNDHDCPRILATVIKIAQLTLKNEPLASFAFTGVHVEGKEKEDTIASQRYRVYRYISENLLGSQTFLHGYEEKSNSYLLVNKGNQDPVKTYDLIVDMFTNEFQDIGNL